MSKGKNNIKFAPAKYQRTNPLIQASIRTFSTSGSEFNAQSYFALVYAAYIAAKNDVDNSKDLLERFESKSSERKEIVTSLAGANLNAVFQLAREYYADELLAYMYACPRGVKLEGEFGTPESISKLALKILDAQPEEKIADFGSGYGAFLLLAAEQYQKSILYGIEINPSVNEISKIRAELFSDNTEIELGDIFALPDNKKFNKIFSNYPFGVRPKLSRQASEYIDDLNRRYPEIRISQSSAWVFNALVLDHLTEGGKAVVIANNSIAWNPSDRELREYFVRNGFVEAVIALPTRLFDYTAIPATMIVFSRGNKTVRMIDATELCEQGRRVNLLTDSSIDSIVKLLAEGGENALTVDLKRLQDHDYTLDPFHYFEEPVEIKNGVEFASLIKRVTRGAALTARELDEMVSLTPTDTQYLMLANIQNGFISEDLPYLDGLNSKLEKYLVKNRNLLLSKIGAPVKVAVAEVEDGRKLLGNGNLFIIELDEQKVNPYYLQAYLNSETGTEALRSIVVGAAIPNISIESLKRLTVPLPPMKEQNEIAELFQAKRKEIKSLQSKLQKIQNELKYFFNKEKRHV